MASVTEFEGRRIRAHDREALGAAKARGVNFGSIRPNTITRNDAAKAKAAAEAEQLRGVLAPMAAAGMSLAAMVQAPVGRRATETR